MKQESSISSSSLIQPENRFLQRGVTAICLALSFMLSEHLLSNWWSTMFVKKNKHYYKLHRRPTFVIKENVRNVEHSVQVVNTGSTIYIQVQKECSAD